MSGTGKAVLLVAIVAIAFLLGVYVGTTFVHPELGQPLTEVCFSPREDCASIVVRRISEAKASIHVLMFTFTLQRVADALIEAKSRGVDVRIVMERNQDVNNEVHMRLAEAGIEVRMDNNEALMHNKIAIIDSTVVITGSFNWTQSANNSNNENLLVIGDTALAQSYESQFQTVWNQSST